MINGGHENGGITITLLATNNGQARFGIDAPKSVCIDREEIHDKRAAEKDAGR